jgi:hypothetical protein
MFPIEEFRFGIEHEFAVIDREDRFRDFTNTTFEELDRAIEPLPVIEADYPGLRVGDLGIKSKRWYIEGFERFSESGEYLRTDPKGFEIRTPICSSLDEAVRVLKADLARWTEAAAPYGYRPAHTSLNPFQAEYIPVPCLNAWEEAHRQSPEELTAHIHMLTYGPDVSFSHPAFSADRAVDIGRKLTFYSPYIVPFSFSSPFYAGELWGGYSRRTFYRTGARPSALVFVEHDAQRIPSFPTLTDKARLPAEIGRIEFKAFDCVADVEIFRSLGTLLLGVALDTALPGRALVPDGPLHKLSATRAFHDADIHRGAAEVLAAAREALPHDLRAHLEPLEEMLDSRTTPADRMIEAYRQTGDIVSAIG